MLEEIGTGPVRGEALPGYVAWPPDRRVTLYRNRQKWEIERLEAFDALGSGIFPRQCIETGR
ncbi:MAG TPA: hypothetical protein EYG57_04050 [Planctomycetes bacterium]|nr:hypothetical protein [Planctomycetota bacterium]